MIIHTEVVDYHDIPPLRRGLSSPITPIKLYKLLIRCSKIDLAAIHPPQIASKIPNITPSDSSESAQLPQKYDGP